MLEFSDGETIVKQGELSDCLFVIAVGAVRVSHHQQDNKSCIDIATLLRGECFGEVALLTGEPRTADVVAIGEQTVVLRLSRERFNCLMKQHNALAIKIAGILAQRVTRTTGQVSETCDLPSEDFFIATEADEQELPSSNGLRAGWSLGVQLRNRRFISSVTAFTLCGIATLLLNDSGLTSQQIILFILLLGATVVWSFDAFSYHAVALALPLTAVLLKAASPVTAFSGFSHPSWFLVLGVFAISAAISRTGLMYRLVLLVVGYFPASYRWQTFALAFSGLLLTPVIPSSNGRAVLAGPLISNISEIMRFRRGSAGSIGMSMAALLGFGHMSFMFMNGTATCLLAFGLLPAVAANRITWGSWFIAALPLGLVFFAISYLAVLIQYRPKVQRTAGNGVIKAQLRALGSCDTHELITID
jgi:branched-chain amino acid transport system substrate-binding protein